MAGATSKLSILIEAKNQASGAIKTVEGDLKGLDKAAGNISGGLAGLAAGAGIAGIAALGTAAVGAAIDMAKGAAEAERLGTAFDNLAGQAGQAGDEMLSAMQEAAHGTISNAELMASANRAMLLGVADSASEMAQLLEVAGARGKAMGESTAQAFSDLVTGIGRMSPMILDNLGITVDAVAANEAYARSIGTTAEKLTDAEKKQALLNAVIADSTQIIQDNKAAGDDAASNYERMDAALQNAKDALGEVFSPAIAAIAQALASAVSEVTGHLEEMGQAADLSDLKTQMEMADQTMAAANREILSLQGRLDDLAAAQKIGSEEWLRIVGLLDQAEARYKKAEGATLAYNQALLQANASLVKQDHDTVIADLALGHLTTTLGTVTAALPGASLQAEHLAGVLAQLKAQSDATSAALAGMTSAAIGAIHSAASAAVGIMPASEIAKIYGENTKHIAEQVKVMKQVGMTQDEIDFKTQEMAKKASLPFDLAVEAAREAEKANNHVAKSVDTLSKEYTALEGTVQGVLQAALDPGVGVDPQEMLEKMGVPRADAINENARRLADIAANGLKDQDWLGEFQKEVPDIWKMIRLAQNPQEEAAHLLQDFQDGLLTSPIDKAKAKEIIKRQIMGDQNMAALATEIATELANEMGIPMQQALAAAQGTLGGGEGMGTEAATTFADSASAALDEGNGGGSFVTKFTDQMKASYGLLSQAGKDAGKLWGSNFLEVVGENVPAQLIKILVDLTTPGVMAALAQKGSLTGAVP